MVQGKKGKCISKVRLGHRHQGPSKVAPYGAHHDGFGSEEGNQQNRKMGRPSNSIPARRLQGPRPIPLNAGTNFKLRENRELVMMWGTHSMGNVATHMGLAVTRPL